MARNGPLPEELSQSFLVGDALAAGVSAGRLRGSDLERPFHGVRRLREAMPDAPASVWDARRADLLRRAHAYAPKLGAGQFFSHTTAAVIWGAPVPLDAELHVSVIGNGSLPRTRGVRGRRVRAGMAVAVFRDGLPVSSPASTWAMRGELSVPDLVALGDYFCRVWREGFLRPDAGRPPLTTPRLLDTALAAGRRRGAERLRAALPLIRLDSWSPRESLTRVILVQARLPEPQLNIDLWSARGKFLGCVDMCFPEFGVVVEYQGRLHGDRHAKDVERIERLRAHGWVVIQVTSELIRRPAELAGRVRTALLAGGWRP
ncbi:hypothetical protein N8K70_15165 [Microbacterium betulae]|uniref:DUF559 domain-containing protein n=1 Tax=Microbacterium betulae TaxID=2981139 RepID=A0AA97FHL3_9MICO|nr:hypothetical protein [Microbacterium sp. AB]WOF22714.1 hypothetical protein N8K70_15165 [Microbacterium sp. AB]